MHEAIVPAIGGLYSVRDSGQFCIVKVLALDPGIVHLRSYAECFEKRPMQLKVSSLSLGDYESVRFGIGRFPLAQEGFTRMEPALIDVQRVTEEEVEGYHIWREAWEAGEAGIYSDMPTGEMF